MHHRSDLITYGVTHSNPVCVLMYFCASSIVNFSGVYARGTDASLAR